MKGSRIHVMGVAYKRDIDDMRESPALDVMMLLQRRGGSGRRTAIRMCPRCAWTACDYRPVRKRRRRQADCVVIVTDHAAFDYRALVERAS